VCSSVTCNRVSGTRRVRTIERGEGEGGGREGNRKFVFVFVCLCASVRETVSGRKRVRETKRVRTTGGQGGVGEGGRVRVERESVCI